MSLYKENWLWTLSIFVQDFVCLVYCRHIWPSIYLCCSSPLCKVGPRAGSKSKASFFESPYSSSHWSGSCVGNRIVWLTGCTQMDDTQSKALNDCKVGRWLANQSFTLLQALTRSEASGGVVRSAENNVPERRAATQWAYPNKNHWMTIKNSCWPARGHLILTWFGLNVDQVDQFKPLDSPLVINRFKTPYHIEKDMITMEQISWGQSIWFSCSWLT